MAPFASVPSSRLGPRPGRVLALDYGRRRIGMALSDELGLTAAPLGTLERSNRRADLRRLRAIVRKHQVGRILVGLPIRLDGTPGAMAEEVERFAEVLRKELGLAVELRDERLTSWEAEQALAEVWSGARRARRAVDDVAAAVLLRDYLNQARRHRAERAARG